MADTHYDHQDQIPGHPPRAHALRPPRDNAMKVLDTRPLDDDELARVDA